MHLVIHDASLRKVAFVDNTKQNTLKYIKYEWYRSLETAGSTFTVTIQKKVIQTDNHYEVAYNNLNERSFITFKAKNKTHLFSVMVVTEDEETITCECESTNLELINEYANPYKASKTMTFVEYCNAMDLLSFTYLTIGLNEVSDKKLTLEWESQDTKLARLLSLANKFDAEIEFDTRLNVDSSIKQFILNVYHENDDKHQGVGRVREDVQLVYGKNVKSVTRTIDKTNVVNAIRPTGTKDGNTVVISGLSAWEEKNEDGVVEFYQKGEVLYAPISMQLYPSAFTHDTINDQWTRKDITVDSDNPTVVRAEGIKALKRLAYPYITYEVDGFFDANVGDTVKVIDDGFVPKLILKARVIEQYIYDDETKNKTVLGNFTALENRISDDMQARLNDLVEQAKPYTIKLATNNGVVFKNNIGQSIVTPTLYKGGKPVTSGVTWRWALDGNVTTGMTYTVRGADVADTATLTVSAYVGNDEVATYEVSFVNVFDGAMGTPGTPGKDGRTPYVHTAWANNASGTSGFSLDDSTDKLYIGIYTDFEPADSTDPTKYKWTLIKGEKGDPGNQGLPGIPGADGRTPYTHWAYAWSADGTDRFTTVYPKANYLVDTSFNKGLSYWRNGWNLWAIDTNVTRNGKPTLKGTFTEASPSYKSISQAVSINGLSENDDVVFSVWAKSDNPDGQLHLELWGSVYFADKNVGTEWTRISIKGKLKSVFDVFVWNTQAGTYWISEPKLEKGTEVTPYVPSSSEDYTNAYPSYMGTYTDYIEDDSANHSDYTWTRILGQEGADGIAGKDGKGITGTVITYGLSTSDSTQPSTWTSTVPTLIKGQYLWTKTVWTYSDSTNETGYTKTYIAKDGNNGTDGIAGKDGVGIVSTTITYGRSTSGTSNAGITWTSSVPNVPSGEFLWTKTVWTYTDNTTETGYSVARMGTDGAQGTPGPKGADGKSSYTHIAYANMTQLATENSSFTLSVRSTVRYGKDANWFYKTFDAGTYTATNATFGGDPYPGVTKVAELVDGFSTSNSAEKAYIGVYVDFNSADSTNPADYNWTLIKGSDGAQGIPGVKGADGRTPYVHWAYSDNADGTGITLTDNGQRYMGYYTDYTQADSTDKTKYRWADRWAKIEVGGRNLWIQSKATGGFVEESLPDNHITGQKKCYKLTNNTSLHFNIEPYFSSRLYQTVTLSAWVKYENVVRGTNFWNVFNCFKHTMVRKNSSTGVVTTGTDYLTLAGFTGTSDWKYISYTYDYSANKSYDQLKTPIYFNLESVSSGTAWVTGAMIQFGTIATGHELAPEDIEKELDSKADQAFTEQQLNLLTEKAQQMKVELEARAAMETLSALERAYKAYVEANDQSVAKSENYLIETARRVDAIVETLGGLKKTKTFIDTYITEANEGIVIGTNDNVSQIRVTHDRIAMYSAGKEVMYISQGVIHIDNGVFTKSLQIGRFVTSQHESNPDINICRYVG